MSGDLKYSVALDYLVKRRGNGGKTIFWNC